LIEFNHGEVYLCYTPAFGQPIINYYSVCSLYPIISVTPLT